MIRTSLGRGHKADVALFKYLVTRATRLEVISALTTKAFLAAFRRFVVRRGLCRIM